MMKTSSVLEQADALRQRYSLPAALSFAAEVVAQEERDFKAWLRDGVEGARGAPRELRASLGVGSGIVGAYLVPGRLADLVIEAMRGVPGMRAVATVIPTEDGGEFGLPVEDDTGNTAEIVPENTATDDSQDPEFLQVVLNAYLYSSGSLRCSNAWLQDSPLAEEVVLRILARRIARLQNLHFTTGDDAGKPSGLLQTCEDSGVTTASATELAYAEAFAMMAAVDGGFLVRGSWMCNPLTIPILAAIATPGGGAAWQAVADNPGGLLLGRPVRLNPDFPLWASGQKALVFGDLGTYVIREVGEFAVKRTFERYAEYLQSAFLGFHRADGELSVPEAVKYLTVGA